MGEWALLLCDRVIAEPPVSVSPERWEQVLADAASFLDTWGAQAAAMDWTANDLFAVPPGPDRWGRHGVVGLLRGRRVIAITADAIVIANGQRDPHRYRRSENAGAVMLWDEAAFSERGS